MIDQAKTRFILLLGVLGVTSSAFIIRYANQPSYILAGSRVLITGLLSFLVLNKSYEINLRKDQVYKIILAGVSLATHFGWWFDSLNYLPVGTSLSLTNTAPVWMAFFLLVFFDTKPKLRQLISILLVILGSTLLFYTSQSSAQTSIYGLVLALGSAIGFAVYLIMAREMVPQLGLWKYFGLVNLVSAFILLLWSIPLGQSSAVIDLNLWIFGLLLAIFPGICGHAIYNWTIPKLDTIDVGVATLGEPILGTLLAWIILDEFLSNLELIAIGCLILAISFTIERSKRDSPETIEAAVSE